VDDGRPSSPRQLCCELLHLGAVGAEPQPTTGILVSSFRLDDIPAFNKAVIESVAHGVEAHA
jgi:hypothetical protein